jgi:hypothetical protein
MFGDRDLGKLVGAGVVELSWSYCRKQNFSSRFQWYGYVFARVLCLRAPDEVRGADAGPFASHPSYSCLGTSS